VNVAIEGPARRRLRISSSMIEYVMALAFSAVAGWLLSRVGARSLDGAVSAFAALIGGWRGDGWPRGVQEEDRDRRWGEALPSPGPDFAALSARLEPAAQSVTTVPLHGRTRAR